MTQYEFTLYRAYSNVEIKGYTLPHSSHFPSKEEVLNITQFSDGKYHSYIDITNDFNPSNYMTPWGKFIDKLYGLGIPKSLLFSTPTKNTKGKLCNKEFEYIVVDPLTSIAIPATAIEGPLKLFVDKNKKHGLSCQEYQLFDFFKEKFSSDMKDLLISSINISNFPKIKTHRGNPITSTNYVFNFFSIITPMGGRIDHG